MRWIAFLLLPAALLLAAACDGDGSTELTATPTESAIPSGFTTYTDEKQLFSISYPSHWEVALSELPEIWQALEEALESREADIPLEEASVIFLAGVPAEEGADVNVNIIVEPAGDLSTLEQAAEASVQVIEAIALEYTQFAQSQVVVGGRQAVIFDIEMAVSADIPKQRGLTMIVLDGNVLWTVTCGTSPEKFSSAEETCNQVVRSLRILP